MKRFSFLKAVVLGTVVAAAVVVSVNAAQATPGGAKAVANGAIVQRIEDGCLIIYGDWFVIADVQDVQTPSGNEKFTCTGQVAPGTEPSKAVVVKDLLCGGFSGSGLGDLRVTPSGNMIFTCQIRL